MTDRNNNLPVFAEELIIENKTEKSVQTQLRADDILKTNQLIPHNFIQLETKERNYMCSTEGWKEPACERYGFTYENKWIQLDIPCGLMKKLELKRGENIIHPVYISSSLLNKEPKFGGINLEKENEIFLLKPLTSEKETQTELNEETTQKLEKKIEELEKLKKETNEQKDKAKSDLDNVQKQLNSSESEKASLQRKVNELSEQIKIMESSKNGQITNLQQTIKNRDQELAQKNSQISSLNSQVSCYSALRSKIDEWKRNNAGRSGDWWWQLFQNVFYSADQVIRSNYQIHIPNDWSRESLEKLCRDMKASSEAISLLQSL